MFYFIIIEIITEIKKGRHAGSIWSIAVISQPGLADSPIDSFATNKWLCSLNYLLTFKLLFFFNPQWQQAPKSPPSLLCTSGWKRKLLIKQQRLAVKP